MFSETIGSLPFIDTLISQFLKNTKTIGVVRQLENKLLFQIKEMSYALSRAASRKFGA